MSDYVYHMCVLGQLTPRQKIMATKLMRESEFAVTAMDEMNAKDKNIVDKAKYLVIFSVGSSSDVLEGLPIEWPIGRLLVEEEDFPFGTLPKKD